MHIDGGGQERGGTAMRGFVGAVAAAGTALVTLFVAPTAAHAATCYASSCTYEDPQTTGCAADAITAKSVVALGRTIELRYSRTCRAAWARVRNGAEGDYAYIYNNIGYEAADRVAAGSTSVYTVMVNDAGYSARACLDGANYCTAWY
jgi:hypothetical protein